MAGQDGRDGGRVGGRIRRYARVTSTMTGLAARMAGERYLGIEIDRAKHAADLRDALGGLKGPCLLYTSPSPRDATLSRMPSSA